MSERLFALNQSNDPKTQLMKEYHNQRETAITLAQQILSTLNTFGFINPLLLGAFVSFLLAFSGSYWDNLQSVMQANGCGGDFYKAYFGTTNLISTGLTLNLIALIVNMLFSFIQNLQLKNKPLTEEDFNEMFPDSISNSSNLDLQASKVKSFSRILERIKWYRYWEFPIGLLVNLSTQISIVIFLVLLKVTLSIFSVPSELICSNVNQRSLQILAVTFGVTYFFAFTCFSTPVFIVQHTLKFKHVDKICIDFLINGAFLFGLGFIPYYYIISAILSAVEFYPDKFNSNIV